LNGDRVYLAHSSEGREGGEWAKLVGHGRPRQAHRKRGTQADIAVQGRFGQLHYLINRATFITIL
jgi:hypothetical protein